jgi:hypothetical protein
VWAQLGWVHMPPTEDRLDRGSPQHGWGRVSTDKRFEKVQKQKGKLLKFTTPFFCLSIPNALLRINFFW